MPGNSGCPSGLSISAIDKACVSVMIQTAPASDMFAATNLPMTFFASVHSASESVPEATTGVTPLVIEAGKTSVTAALSGSTKSLSISSPMASTRSLRTIPAPRDRYPTHAEIDRLLAVDGDPHIRLAILLMLTTAARIGAVLDLKWDRVDMLRAQINLRPESAITRKGQAVVPINATLRAALTVAKEAALSDFVVEYGGKQVGSIKTGFRAACGRAKLSGVTPHVLRHTAAVHMVEAGIPITEVAQYLGHSNPSVTFTTYGRFSPDHLRKAADVLEFGRVRQVR